MKLMLLGKTGQVGRELQRSLLSLGELVVCDRNEADLSELDTIPGFITQHRPDVIVNAAAYTAVDKAEQESGIAKRVNAEAPGVIAEAAERSGCLMVHYSTDYVFDGTSEHAYSETDDANPLNVYGETKLAGERSIQQSGCDHLIFRTSWVYASHGSNFMLTMLRLAREREQLDIIDDQIGAPTWAAMIADVTALALSYSLRERASGEFVSGLYNLASRGETSWHGFASQIFSDARDAGLGDDFKLHTLNAISSSQYPTAARRPMNSRLDVSTIEQKFGISLPDWRRALSLCIGGIR